jgi:A/G-specific adenine glycosylase
LRADRGGRDTAADASTGLAATQPSAPGDENAGLADALIAWQKVHGRHDLPWQASRDPYRVWLSEIMLQQTQVSTVLGYYGRFLERFPTVQHLAEASQDEVLAAWSGLGYYSRARNLHRCAQAVVGQHGGRFPDRRVMLEQLPGIGRTTAAAIAAFCFGERAAILDGNVRRVLARATGFAQDLAAAAAQRRLWDIAESLLPPAEVDVYTQGLMDLGATVCLARRPSCARCPLADRCVALAAGDPQRFPVKTRRSRRSQRSNALLWLRHRGLWLLQRRPQTGVWAGLWSLPEFASVESLQMTSASFAGQGEWRPAVHHVLTHFDWTLTPLAWEWPSRRRQPDAGELALELPGDLRWSHPQDALAMGLPAPVRRLFELSPAGG